MGKRSDFKRRARDCYDTPFEAVVPLVPHLNQGQCFAEPCAGTGHLRDHLIRSAGMISVDAFDIEPRGRGIERGDALSRTVSKGCDLIITNPLWSREILHPMIEHFRKQRPTWLLFDADWMHTKQSAPYIEYCAAIVSVGRVKWIPGTTMTGKDNCCWYLFTHRRLRTQFFGRTA